MQRRVLKILPWVIVGAILVVGLTNKEFGVGWAIIAAMLWGAFGQGTYSIVHHPAVAEKYNKLIESDENARRNFERASRLKWSANGLLLVALVWGVVALIFKLDGRLYFGGVAMFAVPGLLLSAYGHFLVSADVTRTLRKDKFTCP